MLDRRASVLATVATLLALLLYSQFVIYIGPSQQSPELTRLYGLGLDWDEGTYGDAEMQLMQRSRPRWEILQRMSRKLHSDALKAGLAAKNSRKQALVLATEAREWQQQSDELTTRHPAQLSQLSMVSYAQPKSKPMSLGALRDQATSKLAQGRADEEAAVQLQLRANAEEEKADSVANSNARGQDLQHRMMLKIQQDREVLQQMTNHTDTKSKIIAKGAKVRLQSEFKRLAHARRQQTLSKQYGMVGTALRLLSKRDRLLAQKKMRQAQEERLAGEALMQQAEAWEQRYAAANMRRRGGGRAEARRAKRAEQYARDYLQKSRAAMQAAQTLETDEKRLQMKAQLYHEAARRAKGAVQTQQ